MCGPSGQQTQITDEQQEFFKNLTQQYSTIFGENQGIVSSLTSAFTPILEAGPSQTGYSPSEANALNTQATEKTATDYAQAQRATAQMLAGRGGGVNTLGGGGTGSNLLPSSVNANILANNANAAATERATLQNQNLVGNYQQGYQNWNTAATVLGNTAGLVNPTQYAGQVTGAGQQAAGSAEAMAQEQYAPWGAAIGALGSVGGLAAAKAIH